MNTNKEDMRELAAQLYALVISTMTGNALQTAVHNLVKITKDNHVRHPVFIRLCALPVLSTFHDYIFPKQSPETQHGAVLALGYMVGRYMSKKKGCDSSNSTAGKGKPIKTPDEEHGDLLPMATKTIGMELQDKTLVPFCCGLAIGRVISGLLSLPPVNHRPRAPSGSFLDSSSALLAIAACTALGEIARNGPLLISAEGDGFTKLSMVKNLLARIPSGKESTKVKVSSTSGNSAIFPLFHVPSYLKWFLSFSPIVWMQMKERAIQTLGYLPVGDGAFPHQKKLLQGLMDSVEV